MASEPAATTNDRPAAGPQRGELLVVDEVRKYFPITRGIIFQKEIASVKAVDGVTCSAASWTRRRRSARRRS